MRLIAAAKRVAKRYWPALSIRTILLATFLFVAALPGVGAVALRVYENTLVQQTEAELIAQGAVLAAAYRAAWGDRLQGERPLAPEPPTIDLRSDPVLPAMPEPVPAGAADPRAAAAGQALAPVMRDAAAVTLSSARLLDDAGIVVAGSEDLGMSFAGAPEVRRALGGQVATTLRTRIETPYGMQSPLEWLSRAVTIRVYHVRPVMAGGRVIGAVMLSRSPRGLFVGIYQDRGKIAVGVVLIFLTLLVLAGLLSRGIARPIRELTRATEKVSRGEVAVPDAPATAAIEIRELYAHFAAMAERIDSRARYLRDFAAAVSHEFKTPLAGIRGALELLDEHEMTREERRRFLANAGADADRLTLLVQRLLELARADMAKAEGGACDLGTVTGRLSDTDILVRVAGDGGEVPIDADTLAAILSILIENSRQAGARAVTLRLNRAADRVTLRYEDDGSGIPPGDRDRIFTPFFTSRREQGGTGLGLAIARSLLSSAGGSIALELPERGAAFLLILPAHG
ncbi:HAMP domain-containing histidine kinase [Sphingomonas psychrotolerans]|uniref:histidine kinase n=1 Tax=Sphingomonas psychrotolerans TaxID=1327635 RepID=A0ABU3N796_9SPHN|nr:HAMP domain-containing sensor histidine kinase [Sphingomonas psychrotolerans]MDT8759346.1 HAMP domain-containing histidine kinase [Sphingomonas psychrotolerans]